MVMEVVLAVLFHHHSIDKFVPEMSK